MAYISASFMAPHRLSLAPEGRFRHFIASVVTRLFYFVYRVFSARPVCFVYRVLGQGNFILFIEILLSISSGHKCVKIISYHMSKIISFHLKCNNDD